MSEHPMAGIAGDWAGDRRDRGNKFEDQVVGFLLSYFGLSGLRHELIDEETRNSNRSWLTVSALDSRLNVPFYLEVAPIPNLGADMSIVKLFRLDKRKILKVYETAYTRAVDLQDARPIVVSCQCAGLKGGLAIHDIRKAAEFPGVRISAVDDYLTSNLFIEPLSQVLAMFVDCEWNV